MYYVYKAIPLQIVGYLFHLFIQHQPAVLHSASFLQLTMMVSPNILLLTVAIAAVLTVSIAANSGRNPCHTNRRAQSNGQGTCRSYRIPKKLCVACRFYPTNPGGRFRNCERIYVMSNWCRLELLKYAHMNKCDQQRNRQVLDFTNQDNLIGLDYFVYSVCEMCCDCIPRHTKPGEFEDRLKKGTLIKVDRANCPAHGVADVCKVWPNVRKILHEDQDMPADLNDDTKYPRICDTMKQWKREQTESLYNKDEVAIPNSMRTFFEEYTSAANCREPRLWNMCVGLEKSQNRI